MKKLGVIVSILLSITAFGQETLFSCGEVAKSDFNGWSISPYRSIDSVSFANNSLSFIQKNGGFLSVEIIRKIDNLVGFDKLYLQLDYDKENLLLNSISVFFSADGKNWIASKNDAPTGPFFHENSTMNFCFVKVVFDIQFFKNGRFDLRSLFIQGKYTSENILIEEKVIEEEIPDFYKFFTFENYINIETNAKENYEVMIVNMNGQVIHRSFKNGSGRVELNAADGYYIVGLIADNQFVARKKVYISTP